MIRFANTGLKLIARLISPGRGPRARRNSALAPRQDHTGRLGSQRVILFTCVHGRQRLTRYFLDYYRRLGVGHFLIVNAVDDNEATAVAIGELDCSIWTARGTYAQTAEGAHWANHLLGRYADGRLAVAVDCDHYLIYPHKESRNLIDVAQYLGDDRKHSMHAILVEGYVGPASRFPSSDDADPFTISAYFDRDGYLQSLGPRNRIVVQGGPRLRMSHDDPVEAPALNRIPVVLWRKRFGYVQGTRALAPQILNAAHKRGEVSMSGVLLERKWSQDDPPIDGAYREGLSVAYESSDQLIRLGLMHPGHWI